MGVVLGDLAEIGYDAEWKVISAADVGAPHLRERIWIMGYPCCSTGQRNARTVPGEEEKECRAREFDGYMSERPEYAGEGSGGRMVANDKSIRFGAWGPGGSYSCSTRKAEQSLQIADSTGEYVNRRGKRPESANSDWWLVEPNVGRVAHGVPKRVDRLRGLGNSVVPQIPEMIARRIKQALEAQA
jgi:DNA (cytosine-5)-methyltransferase 1